MDLTSIVQDTWSAYQSFSQMHPIVSSMATAEVTFVTADIITQKMVDHKINPRKLGFTAALAPIYGAALYGLMQTVKLPIKLGLDSPLEQAALGPNLWGNFVNMGIYVNNAIGEKTNYSIGALIDFYKGIFHNSEGTAPGNPAQALQNAGTNLNKNLDWKEYAKSVALVVTAWNVIQWYNVANISEEMRTPFALSFSVPWTVLLTYLSLKGARKLKAEEHTQP